MKVSITSHIDAGAILRKRGIGDSPRARIVLAETVARLSDPYVPFAPGSSNHMKDRHTVAPDGSTITYDGPYAHYQYVGELMVGEETGSSYAKSGEQKRYTGKALQYIDAHTRKSTSLYDISCYDAIGVLGDALFPGGVYTNKSAKQLLTEIIGNDFEIVFDDVDDISLTGAIFSGTKREACQQVLFAWGCAVSTDGRYSIRVYNPGTQVKEVGVDRTYTGASTSVGAIVTEVRITAHTYIPSEQGTVEIGGEKYEDVTSLYTIENPDATETDKANVIEIENATLVSPSNAQEVAQRVYAYYEKRYLSTAKIVWSDEKLGETLQVPTNWGGMQTGDVEKMEIKLSNTVAAQCEIRSAGGQSDHNRSVT